MLPLSLSQLDHQFANLLKSEVMPDKIQAGGVCTHFLIKSIGLHESVFLFEAVRLLFALLTIRHSPETNGMMDPLHKTSY